METLGSVRKCCCEQPVVCKQGSQPYAGDLGTQIPRGEQRQVEKSMSHLPPWPCSQVGFLFLLSDVSSLTGFGTPLGSPARRDKAPDALWMLWLHSLLLAMLQGAIAISQTQVCGVCWLSSTCKCSRRAVSPSKTFFWHKKVLLDHTCLGTAQPVTMEVRHRGGLWRWVRSTGANNQQALSSSGFLFIS